MNTENIDQQNRIEEFNKYFPDSNQIISEEVNLKFIQELKAQNEELLRAKEKAELDLHNASKDIANTVNIVDYKRIEAELANEKQRFLVILESAGVGTWEWNIQTGATVFNNRWAEILGYSLAEISPVSIETWMKYAHPQDLLVSEELLTKHFKGESDYYEFESRMKHKNGSWIWVLDRGKVHKWDDDGKPLLMSGTHTDITVRKNAEKKMKESEEQYKRIASGLTDYLYTVKVKDQKSIETIHNDACVAITGYSSEDFLADPNLWINMVVEEEREWVGERFNKILAGNDLPAYEHRIICKDGSIRWVSDMAIPKHDSMGNLVSYDGVITDITERKKAEDELLKSEILLNISQQLSKTGGWEWDVEKQSMYWTNETYHIHNFNKEDFPDGTTKHIAQSIECFDVNDRQVLLNAFNRCVSNGEPYDIELPFTTNSGRRIWVKTVAKAFTNPKGKITKVVGTFLDITERKLAEQEHNESELRLRSLVRILQFNPDTIQELLDFTLEEAIRLTGSKLGYIYFYDEDNEEFILYAWSKEVMKQCSINEPKTRYKLAETGVWGEAVRQRKPILVNDFSLPNDLLKGYPQGHAHLHRFLTIPVVVENKIVAVCGVANKDTDYMETEILHLTLLMDSTWKSFDKKYLDELVLNQNKELLKLNIDKDRIISVIGHDLIGPFSNNIDLLDILKNNVYKFPLPKIEDYVKHIYLSTKSAFSLLESLLLWAKSQSGRLGLNPEKINLKELFCHIIEFFQETAGQKNIHFNYHIPENIEVMADLFMLKTILRNLVSNAIKFSHFDGWIDLFAEEVDEYVEITVADTGIGMDAETQNKLFRMDTHLTTSGIVKEQGTGLGLLLCSDFAEKHKGKIWVESELGKGSKFKFIMLKSPA